VPPLGDDSNLFNWIFVSHWMRSLSLDKLVRKELVTLGQHRLDWKSWERVWRFDYPQGIEGSKTTLVMIWGIGCIAKLSFWLSLQTCFFVGSKYAFLG